MTLAAPLEGRLSVQRARRRLPDVRRAGQPALFVLVGLVVLAPCVAFMILALSPRLFDQGPQWFTLHFLRSVLTGPTAVAMVNSLWVSGAAAGLGLAIGGPLAWMAGRTTVPGRRLITGGMWLVLLVPSWMAATGWLRLVEPGGVLDRLGLRPEWLTHAILGPVGIVLLLGLRAAPFAFLAVTAALGGLGQEYEDAARVHGRSVWDAARVLVPMLAPALVSALAIGFVESVSDFGVAFTLAYSAHFPLATYQLYQSVNSFPPSFPTAAAMGWLLVASVGVPLAVQARALRGRSYAALSGRNRQVTRRSLGARGTAGALLAVTGFFVSALVVPAVGAGSGSLLGDNGAASRMSLTNYRSLIRDQTLVAPLGRSLVYGLIAATVTVIGGFWAARLLSRPHSATTRVLDVLLLAAVALPAVVFAAGYIFAYNLPFFSHLGIDLYQTTTLLVAAYVASGLPTNARVLVGPLSQIQASLHDAGRVHGVGPARAWSTGVLPVLSRPVVMAWLLTFTGVFLELPISQLLYAPSSPPLSVAIQDNLGNYHYGLGLAQTVAAALIAFGVVGLVLGVYRAATPTGWRRIGATAR